MKLYEDALARTLLGRCDDDVLESFGHIRKGSTASGVIEDYAVLDHVGDAVLQNREDVWAMICADAIAGAKVLVNPHLKSQNRISASSRCQLSPLAENLRRIAANPSVKNTRSAAPELA